MARKTKEDVSIAPVLLAYALNGAIFNISNHGKSSIGREGNEFNCHLHIGGYM